MCTLDKTRVTHHDRRRSKENQQFELTFSVVYFRKKIDDDYAILSIWKYKHKKTKSKNGYNVDFSNNRSIQERLDQYDR